MGKQGKRRRRQGEQDRGIAPEALLNFALMMVAYFPCVVAIISLSHTFAFILSLPLALSFPLSLSCCLSPIFFPSLALLCPSKAFQATVNCQQPSPTPIFMSGVCVRVHMHVIVQVQCTYHHHVCTLTPARSPHENPQLQSLHPK